MNRIKKWKQNFILVVMIATVGLIGLVIFLWEEGGAPRQIDPYAHVKKYEPALRSELAKYGLEQQTDILVALMYQESQGRGGDPMQASESAGLPPNTIKDPEQSIRQGVRHFHNVYTYGKKKRVDMATIIQAYNMGPGYIDFVAAHGQKHSEELARQYSEIQVKKAPDVYKCGDDQGNFRYPYCYGDFSYTTKILRVESKIKGE